ncbi:Uma2 family endonuclease [Sorangium cellulosum]|nr:Uma2 family endonuclease [Sorangium cellulosum]
MSPAERERLLVKVVDALSDPRRAMSEGRPHHKAKSRAIDMLTLHFGSTGRTIYLAEEMAVLYPGEEPFVPDILAVLDVPQPEDDPRMAWVVAEEGVGLSLVLEVLHQGDRKKDLVANVDRYARLRIPEYFVYDRLRQQIHGYRLPGPDAARYQRVVPQMGRYPSAVLGLDLAVVSDKLQFFYGMAELFGSADLIGRLKGMMESLEARAEQAQAQAEQAQAQAEQAQAQAEQAMMGLQDAILAALEMRRIACSEEARLRLRSCQEPATLQRWLLRAMSARTLDELFAE